MISFNADGEAQHIAANYRPLSSLMFFSRPGAWEHPAPWGRAAMSSRRMP